jgi:hypothetical protein
VFSEDIPQDERNTNYKIIRKIYNSMSILSDDKANDVKPVTTSG